MPKQKKRGWFVTGNIVVALLLCMGYANAQTDFPSVGPLVDSGNASESTTVSLSSDQVLSQTFTLRQPSVVFDIEFLVKSVSGGSITAYLVNANSSTGKPETNPTVIRTHSGGVLGGLTSFSYQTIVGGIRDTLAAGTYAVVLKTSNTDGISIGTSPLPVGQSFVATGSTNINSTSPWLSTFSALVPSGVGLGIRINGSIVATKTKVSATYLNIGDVPLNETRSLTIDVGKFGTGADLLYWAQLSGGTTSASSTTANPSGTTLASGPFSIPQLVSGTLTTSQTSTITVQFQPTTEGSFEGTVLIFNDDSSLPFNSTLSTGSGNARVIQIPVRGRGVVQNAIIGLSKSSLDVTLAPNGLVTGSVNLFNSTTDKASFAFDVETVVKGAVQWMSSDISSGTVPKDGSVQIPLKFNATGLATGTYTAQLIFRSLNPVGKLTLSVNLTVAALTNLSGAVKYYDNTTIGVSGVSLSQSTVTKATTVTDGSYTLTLTSGTQTFSLSKTVDRQATGSSERGAILGSDVITVLEKSSFLNTNVTSGQLTAGDINGDGFVDNTDALGILRYLAFLTDNIGETGNWKFQPDKLTVSTGATAPAVQAILMGDVKPNFGRVEGAAKLSTLAGSSATIDVTHAAWQGDELVLPVRVVWEDPIQSLLLSFEFNADMLLYETASLTPEGRGYLMVENGRQEGKVHVALAGVNDRVINEPIFEMRFRVPGDILPETPAAFTLSRFIVNDIRLPVGPSSVLSIQRTPEEFKLAQNYPNPFNPDTQIRFALPEQTRVRLSILNVLGQEVRVLVDEERAAGFYTVVWDGRTSTGEYAASGVYIYRIQTNNGFTASKRMMLLK